MDDVSVLLNELFTARLVVSEGQGGILEDDADVTPDAFTFADQTDVATSTVVTSNTITVTNIAAAASIRVTGGEYSINGGSFTSVAGTVTNGQNVRVRHTSAAAANTPTNTTLSIGGISDTFSSTTVAGAGADTTPDTFTFIDQSNASPNTVVTSNPITVSGLNAATAIQISGGGGQYNINGGPFTSAAGTVSNGAVVTLRVTSGTVLVPVSTNAG